MISLAFVNLVTPKARDNQEFLFNKLASAPGLMVIDIRLKQDNKV